MVAKETMRGHHSPHDSTQRLPASLTPARRGASWRCWIRLEPGRADRASARAGAGLRRRRYAAVKAIPPPDIAVADGWGFRRRPRRRVVLFAAALAISPVWVETGAAIRKGATA